MSYLNHNNNYLVDDNNAYLDIPAFIFKIDTTLTGDSANDSFILPTNEGGYDCYIDWGDEITHHTGIPGNILHTWNSPGIKTIIIRGVFPQIYFSGVGDKNKLISIENFGYVMWKTMAYAFYGCSNLSSINGSIPKCIDTVDTFTGTFTNCSSLTTIPADLFINNDQTTSFNYTFQGCPSLMSIPIDLFRYNTLVTIFDWTFANCASLTDLPIDLFRYNTLVEAFTFVFYNAGITSIPIDLFRYNTIVISFVGVFFNTNITSIPIDLFRYNILAQNFGSVFAETNITSIPIDLFRYNVLATAFNQTFDSTLITSIPNDIFRYNVLANIFAYVFQRNSLLTSVPTDLFKYNTLLNNAQQAFFNCNKLALNRNIFYSDGEQTTRFLNKSVNFAGCFSRTVFSGIQGEAPDLWNCDFGSGTIQKSQCFYGGGNSITSISNYNDIPSNWIN
jgi:hypothetical protein